MPLSMSVCQHCFECLLSMLFRMVYCLFLLLNNDQQLSYRRCHIITTITNDRTTTTELLIYKF
jgi:hypothetical protein